MRKLTIEGQSNVFETLAVSETLYLVLATNLLIELINEVNKPKIKIFGVMTPQK